MLRLALVSALVVHACGAVVLPPGHASKIPTGLNSQPTPVPTGQSAPVGKPPAGQDQTQIFKPEATPTAILSESILLGGGPQLPTSHHQFPHEHLANKTIKDGNLTSSPVPISKGAPAKAADGKIPPAVDPTGKLGISTKTPKLLVRPTPTPKAKASHTPKPTHEPKHGKAKYKQHGNKTTYNVPQETSLPISQLGVVPISILNQPDPLQSPIPNTPSKSKGLPNFGHGPVVKPGPTINEGLPVNNVLPPPDDLLPKDQGCPAVPEKMYVHVDKSGESCAYNAQGSFPVSAMLAMPDTPASGQLFECRPVPQLEKKGDTGAGIVNTASTDVGTSPGGGSIKVTSLASGGEIGSIGGHSTTTSETISSSGQDTTDTTTQGKTKDGDDILPDTTVPLPTQTVPPTILPNPVSLSETTPPPGLPVPEQLVPVDQPNEETEGGDDEECGCEEEDDEQDSSTVARATVKGDIPIIPEPSGDPFVSTILPAALPTDKPAGEHIKSAGSQEKAKQEEKMKKEIEKKAKEETKKAKEGEKRKKEGEKKAKQEEKEKEKAQKAKEKTEKEKLKKAKATILDVLPTHTPTAFPNMYILHGKDPLTRAGLPSKPTPKPTPKLTSKLTPKLTPKHTPKLPPKPTPKPTPKQVSRTVSSSSESAAHHGLQPTPILLSKGASKSILPTAHM